MQCTWDGPLYILRGSPPPPPQQNGIHSEDQFCLSNSADPDEMPQYALCGISSGPSLFAKVPVGFLVLKELVDLSYTVLVYNH